MPKRSRNDRRRRMGAKYRYEAACRLAVEGKLTDARGRYQRLKDTVAEAGIRALVRNDLAVLAAVEGDSKSAITGFQMALALDPNCEPARLNLALLEVDRLMEGGALTESQQWAVGSRRSGGGEGEPQRPVVETAGQGDNVSVDQDKSASAVGELPKCLLLMVTYNRLEYTMLALEAILKLDYPGFQIVVWDNASTDGTVEYLRERLDGVHNVRLELSDVNKGVVYPMNEIWGSDHDAELLVKVDSDTLVPPELVRRLAECHVRSDHFGALSGFHFRKEGEAIADPTKIVIVNGVRVFRQKFVGGCAIMVRRDVYKRIGPIPSRHISPSHQPSSPQEVRRASGPFMDGGWTWYQERLDELGCINGYPWPFIHVDHMEDTRSPHCIRSREHEQYKQDLRGMSLDEFTQELCVWTPH